tara:strand:+ start:190 stop:3168 length:2979 start_codon:yes stop_codon:yes gene_type:complete
MAKFNKKLNPLVPRQFPQHIQANDPLLVEFIKQYYNFMDSAQITLTSVDASDQILLETQTVNFLVLDGTDDSSNNAGDSILNEEETVGEFTKGEIITGSTSGETATILAEDTDNLQLYVSANSKFITGETIVGGTSGAQGVIGKYRANPTETLSQILEYADVNDTLDDFFVQFRNAFLQTIPNDLATGLDKRQLTKNILSLYKRKGTKKGHEIFFRALLNETPELYFPTVDMLRVSDGKFDTQKVLKATLLSPSNGDMTKLEGQTITQANILGNTVVNEASAVVESVTVSTVILGGVSRDVATLVLNKESISGTFAASLGDSILDETDGDNIIGEDGDKILQQTFSTFTAIDNSDEDVTLTCNIESIADDIVISSGGRYYVRNEAVPVSQQKGGGNLSGVIDEVSQGVIEDIIIETAGTGYAVGEVLAVTNPTGDDGTGLVGEVSVVNGGFRLEQDSLEDGALILEDSTDNLIVMEDATNSSLGDVRKIKITNKGGGYKTLPTLDITSSSGSGVALFAVSSQVGIPRSVKILDQGFRYEEAPIINPKLHMQIDNLSGTFTTGETISATNEDNIILESFEELNYSILVEDFRQAQTRLEDNSGGIELEDGGIIEYEEETTEAVFAGAEENKIITEAGERIANTIYETDSDPDFLIVTHNGSDESRLQFETTDSVTGTLDSFNAGTNIMTLSDVTGTFDDKVTITGGTSTVTARVRNADQASMTSTVGTIIETDGSFSTVDGQLNETTKKIQDSLYYQDYSYVVKVGESISAWREFLKSSVHPAGFYVAGEVIVRSRIDAKLKSGRTVTSGIETDEVIEAFRILFGEKLGRRLGTTTDGTSLSSNPQLGIELGASFASNTRDVTLKQEITLPLKAFRKQTLRGVETTSGLATTGPRLGTLTSNLFTFFGHALFDQSSEAHDTGITMGSLESISIRHVGDSITGSRKARIGEFTDNPNAKTNFAIPCEVTSPSDDTFDATDITFDSTSKTFDSTA